MTAETVLAAVLPDRHSRPTRRFLASALAAHLAGDFLLQPDWMVANKLDSPEIRTVHITIYTLGFAVVVALATDWTRRRAAAFLAVVWATHFVLDSRRWTDVAPVAVDQALHGLALALAFLAAVRVGGGGADREKRD